jgi:hypothetical protein
MSWAGHVSRHDQNTECFWLKLVNKIRSSWRVTDSCTNSSLSLRVAKPTGRCLCVKIGLVLKNETVVIVGYFARLDLEFYLKIS